MICRFGDPPIGVACAGMKSVMRSTGYAWYIIAVLALATLLSQVDRHFPSLLVAPLKAEFGISDTAFSLLHGYAFALTYAVMGIPLGRLVDRANRRNLIIAGLLVWSVLTAAGAFAQSFDQLLVTRMGVGVGEAVLAPAAYSIIADYFAPERRGRAKAIYFTSLSAGSGLAMIGSGAILRALPVSGLSVPGAGQFEPWRAMFLLAGLPAAVLFWLLLTIREPARQEAGGPEATSFADFGSFVRQRSAIFARIIGASALFSMVGYGILTWAPALFDRRFGIPPQRSGLFIGVQIMIGGTVGPLFAGWMSDRLTVRGTRDARCDRWCGARCCWSPRRVGDHADQRDRDPVARRSDSFDGGDQRLDADHPAAAHAERHARAGRRALSACRRAGRDRLRADGGGPADGWGLPL